MTANHLLRYHHNSLRRESSIAVIKQIFERGSEEVDDEDVVQAFLAKVIDIRDTSWSCLVTCHDS